MDEKIVSASILKCPSLLTDFNLSQKVTHVQELTCGIFQSPHRNVRVNRDENLFLPHEQTDFHY
jgi:hypothetical protein